MGSQKYDSGSHNEKSPFADSINHYSQRSTDYSCCDVGNGDYLSSWGPREAESFLKEEVCVVKERYVLSHGQSAHNRDYPESIVKFFEVWPLYLFVFCFSSV